MKYLAAFVLVIVFVAGCGDMQPQRPAILPVTVQVDMQPIATEIATLRGGQKSVVDEIALLQIKLESIKMGVDDNRDAIDSVATDVYEAAINRKAEIDLITESIKTLRHAPKRIYTASESPPKSKQPAAHLSVASTGATVVAAVGKSVLAQCAPSASIYSQACGPSSSYYLPAASIYATSCGSSLPSRSTYYATSCGSSAPSYSYRYSYSPFGGYGAYSSRGCGF